MPEQVLVDTSAWISSFRKTGHAQLQSYLKQCILSGAVVTCPVVILELLQGCRTKAERDKLRRELESLEVLPIDPVVWERGYELGFALGRKGLTVPTADLILACAALEYDALILHQDQHYELIAQHTKLQTKQFT